MTRFSCRRVPSISIWGALVVLGLQGCLSYRERGELRADGSGRISVAMGAPTESYNPEKAAEATGTVFDAQQSGRVKGRATLSFGFDRLRSGQETYTIASTRITREAEATKGEDATKIGIGAGAGALIGAIAGGKKGAAIGTAVGAGAGTGAVLATRGEEVSLPVGTAVEATLEQPLKIRVAIQ